MAGAPVFTWMLLAALAGGSYDIFLGDTGYSYSAGLGGSVRHMVCPQQLSVDPAGTSWPSENLDLPSG